MIFNREFIWLIILGTSAACSNEQVPQHHSATPGDQNLLDQATLEQLQVKGVNGDMEAVKRLILHYELAAPDMRRAMRWQRVAANHGDVGAMLNLSTYLAMEGQRESCFEAVRWIERAESSSTNADVVARAERKLSQIEHDGLCTKWLNSQR